MFYITLIITGIQKQRRFYKLLAVNLLRLGVFARKKINEVLISNINLLLFVYLCCPIQGLWI